MEGFNELKMNRQKSDALFGEKIKPASTGKNERLLGTELFQMRSTVLEQATLFLPLGLTLFVLPLLFDASLSDLVQIVSVTLIVIWPAYTLVQSGPLSSATADIIGRLGELDAKLDSSELEPVCEKPEDYPVAPEFMRLTCTDISYVYPKRSQEILNGEKAFTLDADDFSIGKGELVILRGGNGSGKSTFMRILEGLAKPSKGAIEVDGVGIDEIDDASYRGLFSIVMADFHLFDKFYGSEKNESLEKWAEMLKLESKISDVLPTESLSSGQKKRMALLAAILENRQILLLDEVAADFDPVFREAYYRQILPELKAEGRTLLVISHDDRYYDAADRILTMREGKLAEDNSLAPA